MPSLQSKSIKEVTEIRVNEDRKENLRRIDEDKMRKSRRATLDSEARDSAKHNAAVNMRWSALFDLEIPQDLLSEIQMQKEACDGIISAKDRIVTQFESELTKKNDAYVKSLEEGKGSINNLVLIMRQQYEELQGDYNGQLKEIR